MKKLLILSFVFTFSGFFLQNAVFAEDTSPVPASEKPSQNKKTEDVQVKVQQISENIHMLQGQGGNIAVFAGTDGAIMVDDDYAPTIPTIQKAIQTFTAQNIKYVINTHWHGDHTGGNEIMGKTGATIIAHDNVRTHLAVDNYIPAFDMKMAAMPPIALPALTYTDTLTLHMNGEDVKLIHPPFAHTDGDTIVYFTKSNVINTGDLFFNGMYPFIDAATGGTLDGMIAADDAILGMADENTKIIPGHGPLSNKVELQAFRDMLAAVRDKLKPMVDGGKTLEEIAATKPLDEFNAAWGHGFLPPEKWLGIVVDAMKPAAPAGK